MKLSREEQIDTFIDLYMVERGDHPTRLRNPIYGEERELCKKVALAMIELIKDEQKTILLNYSHWMKNNAEETSGLSNIDAINLYLKNQF